jgi:hypothetical protein
MVSPVDKAGGDIRVLGNEVDHPAVLEQSAVSGGRLAYGSTRAFGDAVSAPFTSQYIAERVGGEEWRTHAISPPRGRSSDDLIVNTEFKAFSPDLCEAWLINLDEGLSPLGDGALPGLRGNLYQRTDRLCGSEGYQTLAPLVAPFGVFLKGVSTDGAHAIFTSLGKLAPQGTAGVSQLYESAEGAVPRFVCTLPDGKALKSSCAAGSSGEPIAGAEVISGDGERIFWSDTSSGEGKLYVRVEGTQTVAVSKAAEEAKGTNSSRFWGAATDGSEAIFTTGNLISGKATLHTFTLAGEVTTQIAEGIYFVSDKVLAPGATEGKPNLYLYETGEGGGIELIATLASSDLGGLGFAAQGYRFTTARITPDGARAVFESIVPLTGYDNKEATTGKATEQVYRYDAEADVLLCVSCNPSGARPAGGASIPAWQTPMHAARILSEDGSRLYFQSADALTPRDTNGRADVYQWEKPGRGSCDEGDASFSDSAAGCIELISSGLSPLDSRFVEASPTGDDVFFATGAGLLPQDDGGFDIYDARVDGGLPIPQPPPPGCEGEACQSPLEAPNDPTPASSAFEGAGNVVEGGKPRCARGKVRRKGRCVVRKQNKRAKRANHKQRAAR